MVILRVTRWKVQAVDLSKVYEEHGWNIVNRLSRKACVNAVTQLNALPVCLVVQLHRVWHVRYLDQSAQAISYLHL